MIPIGKLYFLGNLADQLPQQMAPLAQVFRLHAEGALVEAFEAGEAIDPDSIKDRKLRSLFIADRALLTVKIGHAWNESLSVEVLEDIDSKCIFEYARYCYYFWNDHAMAWGSLRNLLLLAPQSSCRSLVLTAIFLMGHMLCIGGHARLGFLLASPVFKFFMWRKKGGVSDFSSTVVFAVFPYTLFVSARFKNLQEIIHQIVGVLHKDPFYQNLFQVSCLYIHAYSGDIARAELYADRFLKLQDKSRLVRYQPVSLIMPLLPLALRGYGELIEEKFDDVVSNHNTESSDNIINSHFYRTAALIALCLDRKDKALELVKKAVYFRKQTGSFQIWATIDRKMKDQARVAKPYDPSIDHIINLPNTSVSPQLATALMKIIAHQPSGIFNPNGFRKKVADVLGEHFECDAAIVEDASDPRVPSLRLGDGFITFNQLPEPRIENVWAMVNVIAPSIKTLDANVVSNREIIKRLGEAEKQAAIARMTQMLAHDVRKPFSLLKITLEALRHVDDAAEIQSTLDQLVPEVDRASSSVDGLIADVMEIGSHSSHLIQEPTSPEALIERTLGEIFRVYPHCEISVSYQFDHTNMVNVHVQKVTRVFSNIVGNALQAMNYKGEIWFRTREYDGFVEFCIGNSDSVIPAEDLSKLFEAFFTSGKKSGSGLGLAIAEKVVKAHNGTIWCESSRTAEHPTGKVEFLFTLPVAVGQRSQTKSTLPVHSSEITSTILEMIEKGKASSSINKGELTLEDDLAKAVTMLCRPIRVLVVDDEAVYRRGLVGALEWASHNGTVVEIAEADGSAQALKLAGSSRFDLVITDIDMGEDSLNGFELIDRLRDLPGFNSVICAHSNRIVINDQKRAIEVGADAFILKPVSRCQLLKLTLQAAMRHVHGAVLDNLPQLISELPASKKDNGDVEGSIAGEVAHLPEVAVIEDNGLILRAWGKALKTDSIPHLFESPEDFLSAAEADESLLGRLRAIVIDQKFDNSRKNGLDLARTIKDRLPSSRLLLCSSGEFGEDDLKGSVERVIEKKPVSFSDLSEYLSKEVCL